VLCLGDSVDDSVETAALPRRGGGGGDQSASKARLVAALEGKHSTDKKPAPITTSTKIAKKERLDNGAKLRDELDAKSGAVRNLPSDVGYIVAHRCACICGSLTCNYLRSTCWKPHQFLVHWKKTVGGQDTWEDLEFFRPSRGPVAEYLQHVGDPYWPEFASVHGYKVNCQLPAVGKGAKELWKKLAAEAAAGKGLWCQAGVHRPASVGGPDRAECHMGVRGSAVVQPPDASQVPSEDKEVEAPKDVPVQDVPVHEEEQVEHSTPPTLPSPSQQ